MPGPIPAYSNLPINADYYQPSRFVISNISLGQTTTVTTSEVHNYVIGQQVRLLIPSAFGSYQLNNRQGLVLSIPSTTQVLIGIDSSQNVNAFIASPFDSTITAITQANPCVVTTNNSFRPNLFVLIEDVEGMTELNNNYYQIISATSSQLTLDVDSSGFTAYTSGGNITIGTGVTVAQIVAIGDVNSGPINTGRTNNTTYIEGSFINIS